MKRFWTAAALAAICAAPAAAPPADKGLDSLFPFAADLAVEGEGLARLAVPPEVLAECRADLSDVRILDGDGRQVPYLVDSGRPPESELTLVRRRALEMRAVATSTEEREAAPDVQREVYRLALPPEVAGETGWALELFTRRTRFVRRIDVTQGESALVEGGSVFRLEQPPRTSTRLELPRLGTADLEVRLEGEEGFFLEPSFDLVREGTLEAAERILVDLAVAGSESFDDRTEIVVERPDGIVPDLLVLATATPSFNRRVEVRDEGAAAAGVVVGSAVLSRLDPASGVERLEVALGPVRGDRLRVVIDDGDSPPLESVALAAAIRQPALIFPATASARLYFGGGRAHRPRYDLAGLRPGLPARGDAAEAGARLYDPERLARATLGEPAPNAAFDPTPALAFAMRPGAALDARRYSHRQQLTAQPSAEGLVRVDLGLEVLAAARADLADVRVIDGSGAQWPYLLEPAATEVSLELALDGPRSEDGASRYRLELPVAPAHVGEISLDVGVPFFDRPYVLEAEGEDAPRRQVSTGRLRRAQGDPRPPRLAVGGGRVEALELTVTDGDDAPLPLLRAEGRFPTPRLYFAAQPGEYAVVVGFPDDKPPVYDLERVRDVVLAVAAAPAQLGPVARNPAFSAGARLAGGRGLQTTLLWGAIVLVVGALAWMTLKLARE